jgi:hypothetical protein
MTTTENDHPLRRVVGAVALVGLLALTAACGGDGEAGTDLPDAGGGSASPSASTAAPVDPEDAMLEFAACMREHGVDMPDPGPDGRVMIEGGDPATMEAAEEACRELREAAMPEDGMPQLDEEQKQAFLDVAQCMRDKGYDFEDPQFDGGGIRQRVDPGAGIDPEDPTFATDIDACRAEAGVELPEAVRED